MSEHLDENGNGREKWLESFGANRWLLVGIVALIVIAGIAFGYGYRQQILVGHLTAQESMANATINEMQGQLNTVTAKLNEMTAAQQAAAEQAKAAHTNGTGAKAASGKKGAAESKRLKELQARMEDQQKQLKDTQDEVAKTRSDLEGNLSATRDDGGVMDQVRWYTHIYLLYWGSVQWEVVVRCQYN